MVSTPAHGSASLPGWDIPTEEEARQVEAFWAFLGGQASGRFTLIAEGGAAADVPEAIVRILRRISPMMAHGAAIALTPLHRELTTQQAADLLNISRPSLIKLLDTGEIPHLMTEGGHRRIRFVDVLTYQRRRGAARREALREIAAIGEAYGAYDLDESP